MKLLVSDFDSTFYVDEDSIRKNIIKVKKFQDEGNIFMLSSGRSYKSLTKMCDLYNIPYDYLSCADGSIIYNKNGDILEKYSLNEEIIDKFINLKDLVDFIELQYSYHDDYYNTYLNNDLLGVNIVLYNKDTTNEFLDKFHELQKLYQNFEFLAYQHEEISYYCLKNKGISKAITVEYLKNKFNLDYQDIYTVGDSENDYMMLKNYQGYSIGNVSERVKDVSLKNYNQVSELIDDILKSA